MESAVASGDANQNGTLETNGARIYYEVEGAGEPVVLIHAGVADLPHVGRPGRRASRLLSRDSV